VWAIEQGNISITPLSTKLSSQPTSPILDGLCSGLLRELQIS